MMVNNFLPSGMITVVDTEASKVVMAFNLIINMTGPDLVPNNLISNKCSWVMTLEEGEYVYVCVCVCVG